MSNWEKQYAEAFSKLLELGLFSMRVAQGENGPEVVSNHFSIDLDIGLVRHPEQGQDQMVIEAIEAAYELANREEEPHHPDCPATDGFGCRCDELEEG